MMYVPLYFKWLYPIVLSATSYISIKQDHFRIFLSNHKRLINISSNLTYILNVKGNRSNKIDKFRKLHGLFI